MTSLGAPGSAGDKPGSTSNHSMAVWEKHLLWNAAGEPGNDSDYLSFNNF